MAICSSRQEMQPWQRCTLHEEFTRVQTNGSQQTAHNHSTSWRLMKLSPLLFTLVQCQQRSNLNLTNTDVSTHRATMHKIEPNHEVRWINSSFYQNQTPYLCHILNRCFKKRNPQTHQIIQSTQKNSAAVKSRRVKENEWRTQWTNKLKHWPKSSSKRQRYYLASIPRLKPFQAYMTTSSSINNPT